MKNIRLKFFVTVFLLAAFMLANCSVTGYAATPYPVQLEKTVSSTESLVGKDETISYRLSGDDIIFDPPKDIALVVDTSASMDLDLAGKPTTVVSSKRITMLKSTLTNFISKWQGRNANICIVPFGSYVSSAPTLVSMKDSACITRLTAQINALTPGGNTNIGDGMRVAYHTLNSSGMSDAVKYIITLTDGDPNYYSCSSATQINTYFTDAGIITSNRAIASTTKGLTYATAIIGGMIKANSRFKSFVIGFATPASLTVNLNNIGSSSGEASFPTAIIFILPVPSSR